MRKDSKDRLDVHQSITNSIVAAIEAGAGNASLPWHRTGASSILPKNVATGNAYNGINVLALWAIAQERAYTHSLWGTYKQFQSLDVQVRKGEKAALVVFYKEFDVEPDPQDENDNGRRHVAKASWVTASNATVSVWVKPVGAPASAASYSLPTIACTEKSDQSDGGDFCITRGIATDQGSADRIWVLNFSAGNQNVGIPYTVNEWVHIVQLHTGGVLSAYKNGEFVGSMASGDTEGMDFLFYIGKRPSASSFNGLLDDFRTYNRGLTAAEIKQLYQLGGVKIKL